MSLHFVLTGSLEKVLPHVEPAPWTEEAYPLPQGDCLNVQIAYMGDFEMCMPGDDRLFFSAKATEGVRVSLNPVGLSPVRMACTANHDDDYITHSPAMLPDVLLPYDAESGVRTLGGQWRSIWVEMQALEAGEQEI